MLTCPLLVTLACVLLAVDAVPYPWPQPCPKKCPPNYYCKLLHRPCPPPPCGGQRHKRGAVRFPCPLEPYNNYCPPVAVCLPIKKPTTTTTTTARPPVETCRTKKCPRGRTCQMLYPSCPRPQCLDQFPLRRGGPGFPCPPTDYCPPIAVCIVTTPTTTTTRRPPVSRCTKKCPPNQICRLIFPRCSPPRDCMFRRDAECANWRCEPIEVCVPFRTFPRLEAL